ncbi:hypothetical protein F7725_008964 [Dissostichus mawsoni]|uniref:ATP-grasp domain-containing protein n=1 Tax=Dissostichus mawsoni TaxID=36200 RepID=A0A7J5Z5R6_DISMA|nr:hypothetical protein F7725_008964 [Dissostichus mawsoni]
MEINYNSHDALVGYTPRKSNKPTLFPQKTKLVQQIQQILVAPGNAGTANCGKISNSEVSVSNHAILAQFCKDHHVGLVLVGPEVPLAAGIVDDLTAAGVPCFGPSAKAAQLEASKSFSKAFMERHGIPTARYGSFTDAQEACSFIRTGLAAGKGVIVASNKEEACQAVMDIIKDRAFGSAGETVVVEELLEGEEVSCLCFTDGFSVAAMPPAQDHKRLQDGDLGPMTGGWEPTVSQEILQQITESVLQKTVQDSGLQVFHAGTSLKDGAVVSTGGRVLTVTAVKSSLETALNAANQGVASVGFPGAVYRRDIGHRAIAHLKQHSGVDIAAGNKLVEMIKPLAKATSRAGCNAELGGFAGLFDLKAAGFIDPILVSGTDGVGTKLKIAQACGQHGGLGQDLVAMCVNDVLAQGAEPLFFLDYFSCGRLDVDVASSTAEMPGVYAPGEYDLAGFCVGAVERGALLPRMKDIEEGDLLIGLASSGVHSNGFSLVRKVLERANLSYSSPAPFGTSGQTIYSRVLLPILRSGVVKAYAHITGGGLLENIPRVLPQELAVDLEGSLSEEEMTRTFNCGLGAVLVVSPLDAQRVLRQLQAPEEAWIHSLMNAGPVSSRELAVNQNEGSHGDGSTPRKRTKVAVLISGTEIVLVISNKPGVQGLKRASLAGIQTRVVDHKLYGSRAEFDGTIDQVLEEFGVELVCLAGFMRILTGKFVKKWNGKLMNIHPSLLPSFKGVNAQKQALQAGVRVSGCTVHFVAEEVDAGAIIVQEAVPVLAATPRRVWATESEKLSIEPFLSLWIWWQAARSNSEKTGTSCGNPIHRVKKQTQMNATFLLLPKTSSTKVTNKSRWSLFTA